MSDARQLRLAIAEAKAGQTVLLDVLRHGSTKPLRVILGQAPEKQFAPLAAVSLEGTHPGALEGVVLIELSSQVRQHLGIPRRVQGAVVLDLHVHSAAAQAGLRPGDVIQSINGEEATSPAEVSRLKQTVKERRALVRAWNRSGSHYMIVEC